MKSLSAERTTIDNGHPTSRIKTSSLGLMRSIKFNVKIFDARNYRAGAQVLFWMCLLGTVNLLFLNANMPVNLVVHTWTLTASVIFLVLVNIYYLVPRFFLQKKYGSYVISVLLSIMILFLAVSLVKSIFPPEFIRDFPPQRTSSSYPAPPRNFLLFNPRNLFVLVSYTAAVMSSTVFESVQLHRKQELIAAKIQREKLEAEMRFLKSQINPHFLFNALNNVYTLSLIRSDHTPDVVMKLSEMLRYMLYESNQKRVSLRQEVLYIQNYIDLQQLKDDDPLAVQVNMTIADWETSIAPMILIPFIENAFKHSKIEDASKGWIKIDLTETEHSLRFKVTNSLVKVKYTQDPTGGIGLQNVKRRLELEYPNQHHLDIGKDDTRFYVKLLISLS